MRLWMTEQMTEQNCLKAAAQVIFQLVFMGIYMENMDRMEAARRLRQLNVPCRDHNRMSLYLKKSMCIKILSFLHNSETE